jgi:hypothetical protein
MFLRIIEDRVSSSRVFFPPGQDSLFSGLPDVVFSNQKSQFGKILEDLRLENADIFYGHFGIFYGHLE